jgi:anti-sigma B factor antagonist
MPDELSTKEDQPSRVVRLSHGYGSVWLISFATAIISSPILIATKERWPWVITIPLSIGTLLLFVQELSNQRLHKGNKNVHNVPSKAVKQDFEEEDYLWAESVAPKAGTPLFAPSSEPIKPKVGNFSVLLEKKVACIRIAGRANFVFSPDFKTLVNELAGKGYKHFIIDLTECVLMDSTFLGVLAGFSLKLNSKGAPAESSIELLNANTRVTELLENLGALYLFKIKTGTLEMPDDAKVCQPESIDPTHEQITHTSLEAHQTLMAINPENVARFKDVTRFLAERGNPAQRSEPFDIDLGRVAEVTAEKIVKNIQESKEMGTVAEPGKIVEKNTVRGVIETVLRDNPILVTKSGVTKGRAGHLHVIVSKGRFDKTEPTIYKGEDLDIPTYIRKGIKSN